jgi:hypothetical protein
VRVLQTVFIRWFFFCRNYLEYVVLFLFRGLHNSATMGVGGTGVVREAGAAVNPVSLGPGVTTLAFERGFEAIW